MKPSSLPSVPAIISERDRRAICDYFNTKGTRIDIRDIVSLTDKFREATVYVSKRPRLLGEDGNDFDFSNIRLHFIVGRKPRSTDPAPE